MRDLTVSVVMMPEGRFTVVDYIVEIDRFKETGKYSRLLFCKGDEGKAGLIRQTGVDGVPWEHPSFEMVSLFQDWQARWFAEGLMKAAGASKIEIARM